VTGPYAPFVAGAVIVLCGLVALHLLQGLLDRRDARHAAALREAKRQALRRDLEAAFRAEVSPPWRQAPLSATNSTRQRQYGDLPGSLPEDGAEGFRYGDGGGAPEWPRQGTEWLT
jgi:hypothetical protein